MIVNIFLQILSCFDSHQQVKCCRWVLYLSRLFSIHVLTITKFLKMMTKMGKVLKRRWSKATIQLREVTKARARAIMAPWHHGTAMLPLPRHCHGNNMDLRVLASWHHRTIRLSHRTTAQQELEVRMRKPTKHLPGLQPKAGKWGFSGPQSKQFTWSSCLLDNC